MMSVISDFRLTERLRAGLAVLFLLWNLVGLATADDSDPSLRNPKNLGDLVATGNAWHAKKEYDKALDVNEAIRLDPNYAPAFAGPRPDLGAEALPRPRAGRHQHGDQARPEQCRLSGCSRRILVGPGTARPGNGRL